MSKQLQKNRLYVPGFGTVEKADWTEEHYDQFMKTLPDTYGKKRAIKKWFTPKPKSDAESIRKDDEPPKSVKKEPNADERKLAASEYLKVTGKKPGSQWDVEGIREKQKEWEAEHPKDE